MKRESFIKLTLKGLGYIILGNALCLFMTMGLGMFGVNLFTKVVSISCGTLIFYLLVFTLAWKDGTRERGLIKLGRESCEKKYRWIAIGVILFVFAALPSVILLLNKLFFPEQDLLILYRFVSGSAYPFVMAFVPPITTESKAWVETSLREIDNMSVIFPILMTAYYLLIPVAAQVGYYIGFNDKLNKDKIMYK
ncbi:MAG: hypothetical protein K2O14_10290 [Oscillospiraceae bacterium]|nr:hypothetical protein [Oscillospiraceae bacterium]